MSIPSRRQFFERTAAVSALAMWPNLAQTSAAEVDRPAGRIKLGLCTYLWGEHWDLPTVITNCAKAKVTGVELRTEHKHGVEPGLTASQRAEVKQRFADQGVTLVGLGTNQCFDSPDPAKLKQSIEGAQAFLQLSHDCGGSGVKVKPNDFQRGVEHEKTIAQIGRSLNVLGRFAAERGQQVRLEVHGSCRELPTIQQIMQVADHPSVGVCWNCNVDSDWAGKGLAHNFQLVQDRLGATLHVHELNLKNYPYSELFALLRKADYQGWALLECHTRVEDGVAALVAQRDLFARLTS